MAEYLLELFVPAGGSAGGGTGAERIRAAAEAVASSGVDVRYMRSMYVAAEETCFVLLEAESTQAAEEVARLANVPSNRVSEVAGEPATPT